MKKAMTQEEVKELEHQLEELKTIKRKEVAEKIKVARSFGDLSENSEYDEAKNEQAMVEEEIRQLETILKNVELIDKEALTTDTVEVGLHVKIFDNKYQEELVYQLVGSNGADPLKGKISDESPIGRALKGKRAGETVEIEAPGGLVSYKILEITK